jgi:hypothetical protein
MDWTIYQALILFVWLAIGLLLVIFSNRIVRLLWKWSATLWIKIGELLGRSSDDVFIGEDQNRVPVWMLRIFGSLMALLAVYLFFRNFLAPLFVK